jgi:hypothetical protein
MERRYDQKKEGVCFLVTIGKMSRACLRTLQEANFAEFSFQARKFSAGVPVHVKGK